MRDPFPFKWRHFEADTILCAVRWYLQYALSYRDEDSHLTISTWGVVDSEPG